MSGGARYKRYSEAKMAAVCQSIEKDTLMRFWPHPSGGYEVCEIGQGTMPPGLSWYVVASGASVLLYPIEEYAPGQYSGNAPGCQIPLKEKHIDQLNRIADAIGPDEQMVKVFGEAKATEYIHRPWEDPKRLPQWDEEPHIRRARCWPRLWGGEARWKEYRLRNA